MERSLFQNFLHSKQLEYRNYPPVDMPAEESLFGGVNGDGGGGGGSGSGGGSMGEGSESRRPDAWESMSTSTKVSRCVRIVSVWCVKKEHERPCSLGLDTV